MALTDKTNRVILIVVWVVLVLAIILPLVATRFEEHKVTLSTNPIKPLRFAGEIVFFISMLLMVSLVVLFFYVDGLRNKVDTIEWAARLRRIALIIPWLTIILLALIGIKFVIVLYYHSGHFIYNSIELSLIGLLVGYLLLYSWGMAQYCRTKPLSTIAATCLLEQHEKFVKARDLDKAYSTLLKACEMNLDGVWLWCRLAIFCEHTRKNSAEADDYMAKANELITTKANNIGDKACYLDYLGLLNYVRGECNKGLEYIKQAIDIEPKPFRIKTYEDLLLDLKARQQSSINNIS
ncbi:MAG: hypothetical protein ABSB25_00335 [Sedimentisphaerales bacterium]